MRVLIPIGILQVLSHAVLIFSLIRIDTSRALFLASLGLVSSSYLLSIKILMHPLHLVRNSHILLLNAVLLGMHIGVPLSLSNDISRYHFDGNAILQGHHPWNASPIEIAEKDPSLHHFLPKDHGNVPSIYPPFALFYFTIGAWLSESPWIYRLLASLFAFLTLLTLVKTPSAKHTLAILALHPLWIIESAHNGHVEIVGIFFLSLYLRYNDSRDSRYRYLLASGLIKFWPIILSGLELRSRETWKRLGIMLFAFATILLLLIGTADTQGLSTYLLHWEFHAFVEPILRTFLEKGWARVLTLLGFLTYSVLILQQFFGDPSISKERAAIWLLSGFLFFSPTVHPWYVLWILPLLLKEFRWSWLIFSVSFIFAYEVVPIYLSDGVWNPARWPKFLTYTPITALFLLSLFRKRYRSLL